MAVHCRGQGVSLSETAFVYLRLAWTGLFSSQSVYIHLLNPSLRAFTWKLKGIIWAVGPGEKQEANLKTTTYGLTTPLSYCDFQELGLGRICGVSPHTQVLTTCPQKEKRSPNSARECSAWWESWGHLLDVIYWFVQMLLIPLAYTGDVKKSKVSCKLSVAKPVLCSGQCCQREQNGKGPYYGWSLTPVRHELDTTCPSEWELRPPPWPEPEQLPSKSYWLPNSLPLADWETDCIFPPIFLADSQVTYAYIRLGN